jgi:porin
VCRLLPTTAALLALAFWAAEMAQAQCSPADPECPAWSAEAVYTGEFWRNADGGIRDGSAYLDNLDLTATINGEKLFGLPGLTLFAYGLYNNGHEFSSRYVGDAQGVSNIETVRALRLYELWAELNFGANEAWSLRAGQYDLNTEFDAIETGGLFIQPSHGIGPDFSQTGANGPSIFSITGLAVRGRWQPLPQFAAQVAVLDAVPGDPDEPDRTALDLGDGSLLVGELHYYGDRLAKAMLGAWRYSPNYDDLVAVDAADRPVRRSNQGWYAAVDGSLLREAGDDSQGLRGWLRYGVAAEGVNVLDSYRGAGLVYTGLLPGRPADQVGLALGQVRASRAYRQAVAQVGGATDSHELNIEFTYRFAVTDWLTLQPDVQYIVNPGLDPTLDDALVVGLRFELGYGWEAR